MSEVPLHLLRSRGHEKGHAHSAACAGSARHCLSQEMGALQRYLALKNPPAPRTLP